MEIGQLSQFFSPLSIFIIIIFGKTRYRLLREDKVQMWPCHPALWGPLIGVHSVQIHFLKWDQGIEAELTASPW